MDTPAVVTGLPAFEKITRSLVRVPSELTARLEVGVEEPIPTLPLDPTLNQFVPEEEATVKILEAEPAVPEIASLEDGVDDPIPILPLASIEKKEDPEEEATLNGLRLEVEVACTLKT